MGLVCLKNENEEVGPDLSVFFLKDFFQDPVCWPAFQGYHSL